MSPIFEPGINIASPHDVPALTNLLNSAYRGESSRKGWTTEAHLIAGESRTNQSMLNEILMMPGSIMLKLENEPGEIVGCVNLQHHGNKLYLGMLSVSPELQGKGGGKKLLKAADEYARYQKLDAIYMTVISLRTELIDWYKRHGYHDTGERKPFPEDPMTGKHMRELEFVVLEKYFAPAARN
jgi:ribosomal protein S18 acetylase RimI-like enzyme